MYNVMKLTATNLPEILSPLQNDPSAQPMGMFPESAVESQPEKFKIVYIFTK